MSSVPYEKTQCINFSEELEIKLFRVYMELQKYCGATYMSYTFDRFNKYRFSFRTDSGWAEIYQNEKIKGKPLIESCPLDVVSRQNENCFIMWDLYTHQSQPKEYREIMGMRKDVGLNHGLTLSTFFNGHHDAIAIATEDKKNNLAINVMLNEKGSLLKTCLLECRKEIIKNEVNQASNEKNV